MSPRQFFSRTSSRNLWESLDCRRWQGWLEKEEVPLPSNRKGAVLPGPGTISALQLAEAMGKTFTFKSRYKVGHFRHPASQHKE